ncbi:hypothetical protein P152DRAFT_254874 [Eremomyces bilateralis CBS 781.70]|uniref:Atos-like conserved domain-containing protein n=1 Tax=Eremomyces bilateralis CBS 781.70 TaxID=1392243 RepID=A0A6G1FR74_9PEZI|nr:uncharacterized protein P152DRAFT_254874 [Eremomyces bilateralis CBS 781.70]KAF1808181.1 hypothetical protein P152DRAFT_254874 [Eremomyces bilateralis CBS 781.70]
MTSNHAAGLEIQRPRSAFHSGDFRDRSPADTPSDNPEPLASRPGSGDGTPRLPAKADPIVYEKRPVRSRAVSNASTTSLLFMPPTSPLAKQSTSDGSRSDVEAASRRHTLSPFAFRGLFSSSPLNVSDRNDPTHPSQSYRSSLQHISRFIPQTPSSRRPSLSSDSPPLHHAPLVGSYEESILRGRMSTTPSRPLNFVAQIGVLGRGECKPSLQCPPHVMVGFPAVFYSYNGGTRIADSQPSPYVGLIDLEGTASERSKRRRSPEERRARKQKRLRRLRCDAEAKDSSPLAPTGRQGGGDRAPLEPRSRSGSPVPRSIRASGAQRPGETVGPITTPVGGYRIPPQGHLQIIIKNPHKTAVKLFRVPYDVSDMPVGTKTFVRQRSFVESTEAWEPGMGGMNATQSASRAPLRYLVHLNICCTAPKRHWLYGDIRVVFANRVPDGKESLRCETQVPEPRWSAYRPTVRPNARPTNQGQPFGALASETKDTRHSVAWSPRFKQFGHLESDHLDKVDGLQGLHARSRKLPQNDTFTAQPPGRIHDMSAEDRAKTQAEVQAKFEETYARAEAKERMNRLGRGEEFLTRLHGYGMSRPH